MDPSVRRHRSYLAYIVQSSLFTETKTSEASTNFLWVGVLGILILWALVIWVVNPVGEFNINDDWAFTKCFESLLYKKEMTSTGWGPNGASGGPALIVHLIWASFFTSLTGLSITTLRISILTLGILSSLVLLVLLRMTGASNRLSSYGALVLILNPLFLSQSFTFMSDITLTCMMLVSLFFIYLGIAKERLLFIGVGLFFSLCAVLTRQIGIVIPIAFILVCMIHGECLKAGRSKLLILTFLVVVLPWVLFEFFLYVKGSTPITHHQVLHHALNNVLKTPFQYYTISSVLRFLVAAIYICFFLSPVIVIDYKNYLNSTSFRYFLVLATASLIVFQGAYLVGAIDFHPYFHPNVIFDFGIGPILLKDVYVLGIPRGLSIPKSLYLVLLYWATLALGMFSARLFNTCKILIYNKIQYITPVQAISAISLVGGFIYLGIITFTGFHDRYLIPAFALFLVYLISEQDHKAPLECDFRTAIPGIASLFLIGCFGVVALHDFMSFKRSQKTAQEYVLNNLESDPCKFDGGMEHNGYHCYNPDFQPQKDLSWWWVRQENYLITLGPIPGYQIVKSFPYKKLFTGNGNVLVLKRETGHGHK